MTTKALTRFVLDNIQFKKVKLTDYEAVAIDGISLCIQYNLVDWQRGGEYQVLHSKVRNFLEQILKVGVKPIVILEGFCVEIAIKRICKWMEHENATMLKCLNNEISDNLIITPVLIIPMLIDILEELKIEFHVAGGSAEMEMVAVSNSIGCPVVGSRSSFFMHELKGGYIPLCKFSTSTCYLYHTDFFQKCFKLKDPNFRLLLPAIHGSNNPENILEDSSKAFQRTLETASVYRNCEEYLAKEGTQLVKDNFKAVEKIYCNLEFPSQLQFEEFITCQDLPDWIYEDYIIGHFSSFLLGVRKHNVNIMVCLVENIKKESAWICSRYIRQYLYGFMGLTEDVKEMIRKDGSPDIIETSVTPENLSPSVNIGVITKMTDDKQKNLVLSMLLKTNKIPKKFIEVFDELDAKWKLPILATHYWYHNSKTITERLVRCILLSFLTCSGINKCTFPIHGICVPEAYSLHDFSQWQCVYHDTIALNQLAKEPFVTTSPALLFSGRVAMFYASLHCKLLNLQSPIAPVYDSLFDQLYYLVTSCIKKPDVSA